MEHEKLLAVGLDVGTGGVRALALNLNGRVTAIGRAAFPPESRHCDGVHVEQDPHAWTTAAETALQEMTAALPAGSTIVGIAVDATSGTFLLADARNRPLARAVMYDDMRATAEAPRAAECLRGTLQRFGIEISAAFSLPKIMCLAATQPAMFRNCCRVIHQTDWIVGMLCGRYDVTDISTALKSGADPKTLTWPVAIERDLALSRDLFPSIVLPGTPIGQVSPAAAAATGLPAGTLVVAGCTDGTAGFLASGATAPGDLNVTLGTTLVFKAIASEPLIDRTGVVYNHRHPAGGFLPGAASSTGGGWIDEYFDKKDLDRIGNQAAALLPTGRLVYPLLRTGERFPFAALAARGFGLDEDATPSARLAAGMEGTAMIERLGIERFESLGLGVGPTIFATGGAVSSDTWLRIRASVTRRSYAIPQQPECAVGAAVLAAMPHLGGFTQAVQRLVHIGRRIDPEPRLVPAYDEQFGRFQTNLQQRGYL